MTYFGHVIRKDGECLEKEIIQGTIPRARRRGRPKTDWINNITSWTGLGMRQLLDKALDGEARRKLVHGATNPGSRTVKEEEECYITLLQRNGDSRNVIINRY